MKRSYSREKNAFGNVISTDTLDEDDSDVIPTYQVDFETQGDVNAVMRKLPLHLRRIASLLKTNSPAQVASYLKISRSTVSRAIEKIREHFLASGFEKFHGDATN
jgi:hypothetical protein